MSNRMQPLVRAVFREGVDFPGDDARNQLKLDSPETSFPRRGAQSPGLKRQHNAYFADGFVILENATSKNRVRVPMSNIKSLTFEEDVPKGANPAA